jgi:hypothetical protein
VTHVLLPATVLLRRCDPVGVIGWALLLRAAGKGLRPIARLLGVPRSTLRGWLDRFAARAERIRVHFVRWLVWLAGDVARVALSGSVVGDAVTAIAAAADADAAVGLTGLDRWEFAAAATGGRVLCNTSAPFPAPWTA